MTVDLERTEFDVLPGWADDDHLAAIEAYARSAESAFQRHKSDPAPIRKALAAALASGDGHAARRFFENNFEPCKVVGSSQPGLVTGYYEPHLPASREPSDAFPYPIYRRPPDLVNLIDDQMRGARNGELTHARLTPAGMTEPYPTREAIDCGALLGQGLELAWVANPVELFLLHVQGSGVLAFSDGSHKRISYDGKNGYPYTSIARHLIDAGLFTFEELTMPVLAAWLESDLDRAMRTMWVNQSYIFFRELDAGTDGPLGIDGIALMANRSLAVDGSFHAVGTPIYVDAPDLRDPTSGLPFRRLMVAHDAGSAIKGAERGDIYFGSGAAAGDMAGSTKNFARFVILRALGGCR